jgi:ADP-heptose:LPS heptosyltransferase
VTQRGRSQLRGTYLVQSPMLWSYLRATDGLLRLVTLDGARHRAEPSAPESPRRILLAVGGHLGDAIVASRALDVAANTFPDAALGIVTPSWSKVVLENHPRIEWAHTADHWRINRNGKPLHAKLAQYRRTWSAAVSEISAVGYDIAFDLYPYYPNMAGVLWRAGVPRRYGFTSAGRKALYTTALEWIDDRCHISEKQVRLLRCAYPQIDDSRTPAPRLALPRDEMRASTAQMLSARGVAGPYVILHAGVGDATRSWPVPAWRELAERLTRTSDVVLTGAGAAELAAADVIGSGLPQCLNLAGKLDWRSLEAVVERAAVVVAGETSLGHLAAAHRTPGVAIYSGITDTREWRPLGNPAVPLVVLSAAVSSTSCYRPSEYGDTNPMRGVTVDQVLAAVEQILARQGQRREVI